VWVLCILPAQYFHYAREGPRECWDVDSVLRKLYQIQLTTPLASMAKLLMISKMHHIKEFFLQDLIPVIG
jgi:hypothetical protein